MGRTGEWHTAQVRAWLNAHPQTRRWVMSNPPELRAIALKLAASNAKSQLPGVDIESVDWEAALKSIAL